MIFNFLPILSKYKHLRTSYQKREIFSKKKVPCVSCNFNLVEFSFSVIVRENPDLISGVRRNPLNFSAGSSTTMNLCSTMYPKVTLKHSPKYIVNADYELVFPNVNHISGF